MSKNKLFIPEKIKPWIEARSKYKLSHAQVQMARELGMNPRKFGKLDNHEQEQWKSPLPVFIERCYAKQFGRSLPEDIRSIELKLEAERIKKESRRLLKAQTRDDEAK